MKKEDENPCLHCTRSFCKDKNCLDWTDWFTKRWREVCRALRGDT